MIKKILLSLLAFLTFSGVVYAVATYPDYTSYVNDYTNTLSKPFVAQMNEKLKKYDEQTTNQIAIAMIKTTEPETIEQYSIHLAEKWKPGQKGKDNGILMTFAMQDRKMRIEVGRGLEGDVTDLESKHIIDDIITPEFKQAKYEEGINKGVDALVLAIATTSAQTTGQTDATAAIVLIVIIVLVVIFLIAISPYTPLGGEGTWGVTSVWSSSSDDSSGGTSFGGGSFSGGGSSGSW